jgi:hypothetical protein
MRDHIVFCSELRYNIDYLTKKGIEYEIIVEQSENKSEFNNNWLKYKDIKSALKYQSILYKKNCGIYDLFCKALFKN